MPNPSTLNVYACNQNIPSLTLERQRIKGPVQDCSQKYLQPFQRLQKNLRNIMWYKSTNKSFRDGLVKF